MEIVPPVLKRMRTVDRHLPQMHVRVVQNGTRRTSSFGRLL